MKTYKLPCFTVHLVKDKSVTIEPTTDVIRSVADAAQVCESIAGKDREHLMCIWLNARHKMIGHEIISIGSLTASIAHPREIFKGAIVAGASGIILCHNHPSGEPDPSEEDKRLTRRIAQAGQILGIELLDHVVVAERGHVSLKALGCLI